MNKRCNLCYRMCSLATFQVGHCGVRINDGLSVRDVDNQKIVSSHLDPIEKKPMYHFFPHSKTYSIGMLGCNIECQFCQNYHITQHPYINNYGSFQEVNISHLIDTMIHSSSYIMSYTYSEPIVWLETVLKVAKEIKERGMYNLLVTNGTFSTSSLLLISPFVDAINIDLKGDDAFYSTYAKAPHALKAVYAAIEHFVVKTEAVIEVTTLVIEGVHSKKMIRSIGKRLKDSGVKVWHLSRFFPTYNMSNFSPTSIEYLDEMVSLATECGIEHVYKGNVQCNEERFITCSSCGALIERSKTAQLLDERGLLYCPSCHTLLYGKFK